MPSFDLLGGGLGTLACNWDIDGDTEIEPDLILIVIENIFLRLWVSDPVNLRSLSVPIYISIAGERGPRVVA